jgi:hypothetical protein
MKGLIVGALLVALSCIPSPARAEPTGAPQVAIDNVPDNALAKSARFDVSPGSRSDYAAREKAAPQLAGFTGGGGGIYIGTGALVVTLLVVVVLLLVR